jgi:hypothetical protein
MPRAAVRSRSHVDLDGAVSKLDAASVEETLRDSEAPSPLKVHDLAVARGVLVLLELEVFLAHDPGVLRERDGNGLGPSVPGIEDEGKNKCYPSTSHSGKISEARGETS